MSEELNRFTTSFSKMLEQQTHEIREKVSDFSTALERFSDRLSGIISSLSGEAPGGTAPAMAGGIQLVRIVNDRDQPIPVRMLEGAKEGSQGGVYFSNILGGIGSLFGGLAGGFLGGVLAPFIGAEIIKEAINLAQKVEGIVTDVKNFGLEFVKSVRELVLLLFKEFNSAGIFPVSSLIASLLVLIDNGITLILTLIKPVIDWVFHLLDVLITWLGKLINSLIRWTEGVLNSLTKFFRDFIVYITESALRPAIISIIRTLVEALTIVFSGFLIAFGNVIIESLTWGGGWIAYSIATVLEQLYPILKLISSAFNIEVKRPEPLGERVNRAVVESFREGREFGRTVSEELLGPTLERALGVTTGPAARPILNFQSLEISSPKLPEMPLAETALGKTLEATQKRSSLPVGVTSKEKEKVAAPEAPSSITVNGGINVHITAQTVDNENAEKTARLIAENVLNEIQRLTERDRFRRGLSTTAII